MKFTVFVVIFGLGAGLASGLEQNPVAWPAATAYAAVSYKGSITYPADPAYAAWVLDAKKAEYDRGVQLGRLSPRQASDNMVAITAFLKSTRRANVSGTININRNGFLGTQHCETGDSFVLATRDETYLFDSARRAITIKRGCSPWGPLRLPLLPIDGPSGFKYLRDIDGDQKDPSALEGELASGMRDNNAANATYLVGKAVLEKVDGRSAIASERLYVQKQVVEEWHFGGYELIGGLLIPKNIRGVAYRYFKGANGSVCRSAYVACDFSVSESKFAGMDADINHHLVSNAMVVDARNTPPFSFQYSLHEGTLAEQERYARVSGGVSTVAQPSSNLAAWCAGLLLLSGLWSLARSLRPKAVNEAVF